MDAYTRNIFLQNAESRIVQGEMAITRQLALIERLRRRNASTGQAEHILKNMETVLRGFYAYRKKLLAVRDRQPKWPLCQQAWRPIRASGAHYDAATLSLIDEVEDIRGGP